MLLWLKNKTWEINFCLVLFPTALHTHGDQDKFISPWQLKAFIFLNKLILEEANINYKYKSWWNLARLLSLNA